MTRVALSTVDNIEISTALTHDEGYETAVANIGDQFHPVERYETAISAEVGHHRWVKRIEDGEREFTKLGWLGGLVPETRIKLN